MAKTAKKEKQEAAQSRSTALTVEVLRTTEKNYAEAKQRAADAAMKVAACLKGFEDKGGNNKAFKLASWTKDQEIAKGQDFVRSYIMYCHELGVFDQLDILDEVPTLKKTAMAKAPKAPEAPTAHFGGSAAH